MIQNPQIRAWKLRKRAYLRTRGPLRRCTDTSQAETLQCGGMLRSGFEFLQLGSSRP